MRIAFLVPTFPSLSETFILNQITGLIDRGHHVDIYPTRVGPDREMHPDAQIYRLAERVFPPPPADATALRRYAHLLSLIGTRGLGNPTACLRALRPDRYGLPAKSLAPLFGAVPFLPRRTYDVIHCHFGPHGLRGVFLRRIGVLRGRILTTFHGYDVHRYPRQHGNDVYQPLFQHAERFTVNSTYTGLKVQALGCPPHRLIRLPVGLQPARFQPEEGRAPAGHPVRILTVGRLVEKKGIEYSLRAFAKVAGQRPDIQYDIAGDGELGKSLKDLAQSLGVADRVVFHGGMTEDRVRDLYAQCQLFMLTSVTAADGDQEGQGLVLQEAQAMRMPVLTTHHNGIPDGVLEGESAFLVPERDVEATAERLEFLLDHPDSWAPMGDAGRRFVLEHFDIDKLNDQLVEVYLEMIESTPAEDTR